MGKKGNKINVGDKLTITDANKEHPFSVGEIVKVVTILPNTLLYVKAVKSNVDGYIIKGEYARV